MRLRWLWMGGGLLALALTGASCAKGTTFMGVGGAGAAGGSAAIGSTVQASSSGAGPGGAGGATSSSAHVTSTSASSAASSTSGGCADSPCKLTAPQCGCPANEQCTIAGFARTCGPVGTIAGGQACTGGSSCVPGSLCVGGGSVGVCAVFCATDADCAATGGICALGLNDGQGGTIPNALLCSSNCNLTTSAGCPAGTGCQLGQEQGGQMRWDAFCSSAGTLTKDQPCDPSVGQFCAPSFGCFSTNTCLQYCNVGGPCPAGQTCSPLQDQNFNPIILQGNEIGVCQ